MRGFMTLAFFLSFFTSSAQALSESAPPREIRLDRSSSFNKFERYVPSVGPDVGMSVPGTLTIEIPATGVFDHWNKSPHVDHAPQVRVVPPWPDWEMTTRIRIVSPTTKENFQAGLFVSFSQHDLFYWGPFRGKEIHLERSGAHGLARYAAQTLRNELRIRKRGDLYTFFARPEGSAAWIECGTRKCRLPPRYVGLMAKTWVRVKVVAEFTDFRIIESR